MKVNDRLGFIRLRRFLTAASFFISYFFLIIREQSVTDKEAFVEFPIQSLLFAAAVFIFIRGAYWVVDGFIEERGKDTGTKKDSRFTS